MTGCSSNDLWFVAGVIMMSIGWVGLIAALAIRAIERRQ